MKATIDKHDMKLLRNPELIYGNGVVYVSDGFVVAEFPGHNFDIANLVPARGEFFIQEEVVVALGVDSNRARAILALKQIIKKIRMTSKKGFNC